MKTLLVIVYSDVFFLGGLETHVQRLLTGLSKVGWRGFLVSNTSRLKLSRQRIGNFVVEFAYPDERKTLSSIRMASTIRQTSAIPRFWVRDVFRFMLITKCILFHKIRLVYIPGPVHSSLTAFPSFFPSWGLLKMFGIKVIFGIRGAAYMEQEKNRLIKFIFKLEDLANLTLADHILFCDNNLKSLYSPKFHNKHSVVLNRVDLARFRPLSMGSPNTVVFVGRLSEERGIWDFLRAIQLLRDEDYYFKIYGTGDEEQKVKDFIRLNDIKNIAIQFLRNEEMPIAYNQSTVIVNPMIADGIGNITLEAMACGKCVVKSSRKFNDPVIKDGINGILFRMGDYRDLADKIRFAMDNPQLRTIIGKNAREYVLKNSRKDIEIEEFGNILERFLQ